MKKYITPKNLRDFVTAILSKILVDLVIKLMKD